LAKNEIHPLTSPNSSREYEASHEAQRISPENQKPKTEQRRAGPDGTLTAVIHDSERKRKLVPAPGSGRSSVIAGFVRTRRLLGSYLSNPTGQSSFRSAADNSDSASNASCLSR